MNENFPARRVAALSTIACFSVAALMGIAALLTGDFGEDQGRVLLTTLVIGCASVCMLCYLTTSETRWAPVGVVGALAVLVPTVTALFLVWHDWDLWNDDLETVLKTFFIGLIAALTLAQGSLLLALAGDRRKLTALLWPTLLLAGTLALLISGMILGEVDGDELWRVLGVIAILDVLGTLATIALAKFGGKEEAVERSYEVAGFRGGR